MTPLTLAVLNRQSMSDDEEYDAEAVAALAKKREAEFEALKGESAPAVCWRPCLLAAHPPSLLYLAIS